VKDEKKNIKQSKGDREPGGDRLSSLGSFMDKMNETGKKEGNKK
jgi:hypothetical protein